MKEGKKKIAARDKQRLIRPARITQTSEIPITSAPYPIIPILSPAHHIPTKARRRLETGPGAGNGFSRGCGLFLASAGPTTRAARFKRAWRSWMRVHDRTEISFCLGMIASIVSIRPGLFVERCCSEDDVKRTMRRVAPAVGGEVCQVLTDVAICSSRLSSTPQPTADSGLSFSGSRFQDKVSFQTFRFVFSQK